MTLSSSHGAILDPIGLLRITDLGGPEDVAIEVVEVRGGESSSRPETYWIAEKPESFVVAEMRSGRAKGPIVMQWADSRACPALLAWRSRLGEIAQSKTPSAAGDPSIAKRFAYDLQGRTDASNAGPASKIHLNAVDGTPVAGKVQALFASLSSCWTKDAPQL